MPCFSPHPLADLPDVVVGTLQPMSSIQAFSVAGVGYNLDVEHHRLLAVPYYDIGSLQAGRGADTWLLLHMMFVPSQLLD